MRVDRIVLDRVCVVFTRSPLSFTATRPLGLPDPPPALLHVPFTILRDQRMRGIVGGTAVGVIDNISVNNAASTAVYLHGHKR